MPRRFLNGVELAEQTAPTTPASGVAVYASSANVLRSLDDAGTDLPLATLTGGGRRIFVTDTDPAADAIDGDIWIELP